jgi:hypothetical protein
MMMAKRPPMKFKCTCNNETKVKPIVLGFQTHCKNCGKEYNRDEVLANVEYQKSEFKNK